jgi:uncharacterized repeat protein (TIGR01451 family)
MKSSLYQFKRVGLACVALGAIAVSQQALAVGTLADTTISNTATVNYQVAGVAQTPVASNTATFEVDRKIDLHVQEFGNNTTVATPGGVNFFTTFFLRNDGNDAQGFTFESTAALVNQANGTTVSFSAIADAFDMTNVRVRVDSAACTGIAQAGVTYTAANDTASSVATIPADGCAWVFIVSDAPVSATNNTGAIVRLAATARVPTTLAALTQTAGAETPGAVDTVFGDTATIPGQVARDAQAFADDIYVISAAALSVAKTSQVVFDPFNGALAPGVFPKAIPNARVEYSITLTNTGGQNASVVTITDSIPTNTAFATGTYNAGASSVRLTVGAVNTFCVAELGPDSNADGCFRTAASPSILTVGAPALTSVATGAGNAVTMSFQVTIQ